MVQSILLAQLPLYVLAAVALSLAARRRLAHDPSKVAALVRAFLIGIACQCVHLLEEFLTGFHVALPRVFGLAPWSDEFFITFNVVWLAIWVLAAVGVQAGWQAATFPIWFFALGMAGNGVWHLLLAAGTGAYFPGLMSSPLVGVAGFVVLRRIAHATARAE